MPDLIKARAFSREDSLFFELGLIGSGLWLAMFSQSQDKSKDSPQLFVIKSLLGDQNFKINQINQINQNKSNLSQ